MTSCAVSWVPVAAVDVKDVVSQRTVKVDTANHSRVVKS